MVDEVQTGFFLFILILHHVYIFYPAHLVYACESFANRTDLFLSRRFCFMATNLIIVSHFGIIKLWETHTHKHRQTNKNHETNSRGVFFSHLDP